MSYDETARARARADPRSDAELIHQALGIDSEEDAYWDLVVLLQQRGTQEVFDLAAAMTQRDDPRERTLGVNILAQGQSGLKTFQDETVSLLVELGTQEENTEVLYSIGYALGHRDDPRGIDLTLTKLMGHADADVRQSAVLALLDLWEQPGVLEALMELSGDEDDDVRDWATFGLGRVSEVDTPEIRDTLAARLDDQDENTHLEAIAGLALRKDERALDPLIEALRGSWADPADTYSDMIEVIEAMARPKLLHVLEEISPRWLAAGDDLSEAIRLCRIQGNEESEAEKT